MGTVVVVREKVTASGFTQGTLSVLIESGRPRRAQLDVDADHLFTAPDQ